MRKIAVLRSAETRGITLDHAAKVYDYIVPMMMFGTHNIYFKKAARLLDIQKSDRLLDIGCGTGMLQPYLLEYLDPSLGGCAVGIDAAGKMVERAVVRREKEGIRFEVAAAEALPFKSESFDKATSLFFFHHVDYELKMKAAAEAFRVLKPGGMFIVVDVSTPTNWFGSVCMACGEWLFKQPEIGENRRGKHLDALKVAGFTDIKNVGNWQGYVSMFTMIKPEEST